jgi:hypothetical protein
VDEFWVCQHCKSLNRAGSGKCYGCKNRYGSKPKEVETLHRSAGAPTPLPPPSPAVPGAGLPPAPYLARAVALAPIRPPARSNPPRELHRPHPIAAVRQSVAGWLALRQSVPVAWLGYLTALLMTLVVLGGAILVMNLTPAMSYLLQYMNASEAWGQLTAGQQGTVQALGVGVALLAMVSLLCFSVFLGLTTNNATGLGADLPLLTPYRAGLCWASALWAQARIAVGLIVPAAIIWKGYTIPGLIAMIVAVEIAQRHMDDPLGWLTRPARHLPDLYAKLGVEGSTASPLASLWSISFLIANLLAIAVAALPALALFVHTGSTLAGRTEVVGWQSGGFGPGQIAIALLIVSLAGWAFGSLAMLVPITLGLVQRQRTRKTLVRVGRSRSWVARPDEGGYAIAGPARGDSFGDDPDDRIVERAPRHIEQDDAGFGGGMPGEAGFGGQAVRGPFGGLGGPTQNPGFGGPAARGSFGGLTARGPFGGPNAGPTQASPDLGGPNAGPSHDGPEPGSTESDSDSEPIG